MLHGRNPEQRAIEELIGAARAGRGRLLFVRGEPGIGKTALLDHAAVRATADGSAVLRTAAVEAERSTPFAGLHALLQPVLHRLDRLPEPLATALGAVLGSGRGPAEGADGMLVGLAVRALLACAGAPAGAEAGAGAGHARTGSGAGSGAEGAVLCLVDDAQWLDEASAAALQFAARRLDGGRVSLLVAARDGTWPWAGTEQSSLWLQRLDPASAGALLADRAPAMVPQVRKRVVAEAEGNPLALLELAAALDDGQRAGRIGPFLMDCGTVLPPSRVRDAFAGRVRALPARTRRLLLVAAIAGDAALATVLNAAQGLGCDPRDLDAAERAGLIRITGGRPVFRHPLIRAAVREEATFGEQAAAHRALARTPAFRGNGADSADGGDGGDRRAWHLAAAAVAPDEAVADELEQAAVRARDRRATATASVAFEQAARLGGDGPHRLRRLVAAAEAALPAGLVARTAALVREAGHGLEPATADRATVTGLAAVRAAVEYEQGDATSAARLLVAKAGGAARGAGEAALLTARAVHHAIAAGDLALVREARAAVAGHRGPGLAGRVAAIAYELAGLVSGRPETDIRAVRAMVRDLGTADEIAPHLRLLAASSSLLTGDHSTAAQIAAAVAAGCRDQEQHGLLCQAQIVIAEALTARGRHREAEEIAVKAHRLAAELRSPARVAQAAGLLAWFAAMAGDGRRCAELAEEAASGGGTGRIAIGEAVGAAALGLCELGRCNPAEALTRLEECARHPVMALRHSADLVEAAVGAGSPERAGEPLALLRAWADASGHTTLKAVSARCRALLSSGREAEARYRTALQLHQLSDQPFEQARTDLLYGQWLRRERRRGEARERLEAALDAFERAGSVAFAARARSELQAARGGARRTPRGQGGHGGHGGPGGPDGAGGAGAGATDPLDALTPQERQVVRLAATGETSREIAARLFLSPRTVEHHLYKAFPKLGVSSRAELTEVAGLAPHT